MSVSLLIEYDNPKKEARLVPIATEQVFEKYWQPACSKLGLQWVPLFQSGLPLRKSDKRNDIPPIVDELTRLKQFLSNKAQRDIPQDVAKQIVSRIDNLLLELHDIREDAEAEGYFS